MTAPHRPDGTAGRLTVARYLLGEALNRLHAFGVGHVDLAIQATDAGILVPDNVPHERWCQARHQPGHVYPSGPCQCGASLLHPAATSAGEARA